MIARWLATAALLSLPPAGVVLLANRAAERLGVALGEKAASLARYAPTRVTPVEAPLVPGEGAANDAAPAVAVTPAPTRRGPAPRSSTKGKASRQPAPATRGIYVPSATVLRLAQASAAPRAVPVGVSGPRPAGLRLLGVSGLGIGMRDGDVLTRVMGGKALSVADVVGRILAARAHRLPSISGEFWRQGEVWSLVVEQPYLASAPSTAAP